VYKAAAKKLGTGCVQAFTEAQATDGWNVATRGYVARTSATFRGSRHPGAPQRELAW
jgi:hypothetical protein